MTGIKLYLCTSVVIPRDLLTKDFAYFTYGVQCVLRNLKKLDKRMRNRPKNNIEDMNSKEKLCPANPVPESWHFS